MATTFKKFLKDFPTKGFIKSDNDVDLSKMTYDQKLKACYVRFDKKVLKVTESYIYYAEIGWIVQRLGKAFFKKECSKDYIYVGLDGITINDRNNNKFILTFLSICGITWVTDLPNNVIHFLRKKSILKSVLIKTIYNQETFYKAIGKRMFKLNNVGWRTIREYLTSNCFISIFDLNDFTKNAETSIKVFVEASASKRTLLSDLLNCAVQLNEVIDFSWSDNRIQEEHTRQNRLLIEREIISKSDSNIFEEFPTPSNIKLLNTERDIFFEGKNMHHCLYSCYYKKIKNKEYIAFHMTYPEDCTFSFKFNLGNNLYLDQIFLKYDKPVKPDTRQVAIDFLNKYYEEIEKRLKPNTMPDPFTDLVLEGPFIE